MDNHIIQQNKKIVWKYWQDINNRQSPEIEDLVRNAVGADINWNGPHPFNHLDGVEALIEGFWQPLLQSFPDIKKAPYILLGGRFADHDWISATGNFTGTFIEPWLGIPATGKQVNIRFGEFCKMGAGKIIEIYIIFDILDLMRQAGIQILPPSFGIEDLIPGPRTGDGVLLTEQDERTALRSLKLVDDMLNGLMRYDGVSLDSMEMLNYWRPEMHWYGPSGIGTSKNMADYEQNHAAPFLHAFPDRRVGDHKAHLAEGNYVATTGWPSVLATHSGDYLGCPATGKNIGMRVMDWWRCDGDYIVENWVFIDLIDLFLQFEIDLFEKMRNQIS